MKMKMSYILTAILLICATGLSGQTAYINYAEALQKSIYFYDAQKCGFTGTSRLEWRGPCHLEDAKIPLDAAHTNLTTAFISSNKSILDPDGDGYLSLLGGYHDCGDHPIFGLPQAYSASTLAWGLLEFKQAFVDSGQYDHMLEVLRYFTDFFNKCTFKDSSGNVVAYCYQTGDGSVDHAFWGPPELQDVDSLRMIGQTGVSYPRPGWFASPDKPGSDVCSESAASLAAMYLIMKDTDATYANTCLANAKALYAFGVKYRGCADSGGFYGSTYDSDDLSWAAVWLYEATGTSTYIDDIVKQDASGNYTGYMKKIIGTKGDTWVNIWVHCWDAVWSGMFVKLAILFPTNTDYDFWGRWNLEFWSGGQVRHQDDTTGNGTYLQYSPGGFGVINTWGSARYNTAAELCALIYGKHRNRTDFAAWAKTQMDYIMGKNPLNASYIVGYGNNAMSHPHHRAAHGSFTNSMFDPVDERHTLWGALASGPDGNDYHIDLIQEFSYNEVGCDYNAGFVGALAGLYDSYGRAAGDKPVANFPPPESNDVKQFWMDGRLEQESSEHTQVTIRINATPIHLPKGITGLMCRYFFNISELIAAGQDISAMNMQIYYDEMASRYGGSVTASGPFAWDAANNVYYYEFAWNNGAVIGSRELQFGLFPKLASDYKAHWDPANDYSRQGLTSSYTDETYVPFYHDGVLVYGVEPPGNGSTPAPTAVGTPEPTQVGTAVPTAATTAQPGCAYTLGDTNGDGTIDIVDALFVAESYVGLGFSGFQPCAADVNKDGIIDIVDALRIAQCYVGLISCSF
jgi:endoglucanase